jgi:hypothetical protein
VGNHHESSSPKAEMLTSCITETINGVGHETHAAQESGFVPVLARLAAIPNADGHRIVFAQIPASQKSTRKKIEINVETSYSSGAANNQLIPTSHFLKHVKSSKEAARVRSVARACNETKRSRKRREGGRVSVICRSIRHCYEADVINEFIAVSTPLCFIPSKFRFIIFFSPP